MHVLKRFTENHFPKFSTQLFLKKGNIDVGSLQGKEKIERKISKYDFCFRTD